MLITIPKVSQIVTVVSYSHKHPSKYYLLQIVVVTSHNKTSKSNLLKHVTSGHVISTRFPRVVWRRSKREYQGTTILHKNAADSTLGAI